MPAVATSADDGAKKGGAGDDPPAARENTKEEHGHTKLDLHTRENYYFRHNDIISGQLERAFLFDAKREGFKQVCVGLCGVFAYYFFVFGDELGFLERVIPALLTYGKRLDASPSSPSFTGGAEQKVITMPNSDVVKAIVQSILILQKLQFCHSDQWKKFRLLSKTGRQLWRENSVRFSQNVSASGSDESPFVAHLKTWCDLFDSRSADAKLFLPPALGEGASDKKKNNLKIPFLRRHFGLAMRLTNCDAEAGSSYSPSPSKRLPGRSNSVSSSSPGLTLTSPSYRVPTSPWDNRSSLRGTSSLSRSASVSPTKKGEHSLIAKDKSSPSSPSRKSSPSRGVKSVSPQRRSPPRSKSLILNPMGIKKALIADRIKKQGAHTTAVETISSLTTSPTSVDKEQQGEVSDTPASLIEGTNADGLEGRNAVFLWNDFNFFCASSEQGEIFRYWK